MKKKLIWMIPLGIVAVAAFIALGGLSVQLLWNWLLPPLFGFRQIGFWQGLGILALSRILFGGFGCHGNHGPGPGRRWGKWREGMTPEERERFRERMRERCGYGPAPEESKG